VPGGPGRDRTRPGAAPDWARQALEVRLGRGAVGTVGEHHVVRVLVHPTLASLRALADAADAAALAWSAGPAPTPHLPPKLRGVDSAAAAAAAADTDADANGLSEAAWWAGPAPAADAVDWAVHRALKRVLRTAVYVIEVPTPPA
jgi:hypothetical protein